MQHAGNGKRKTLEQKQTYDAIIYHLNKAQQVINGLKIFTFDSFEQAFFENRNIADSVSFAFDKYIDYLRSNKRISTAESYNGARNSLESFKKKITFAEITPNLLRKYENWMLESGRSITTVGIYLRSLRAIYNQQGIDSSIYPFGEKGGKYSIPTGKNVKKALTVEEVAKIYNHEVPVNTTKEMARDYWMFLYLSNGMNVKDFCWLKWSNIEGDMLTYIREKTKRKSESTHIKVSLKPETLKIINKWGQPSMVKDAFIFPYIKTEMTSEQQYKTVKQLTKTINKYMKKIAHELGIDKEITTYFARHSFATVLKRSGATTEMISELLGHSSVLVTKNYLDSFEDDKIKEQTNVLTLGFSQAN
ncbi:integrase [Geofilum rubicundum JCM 15548]|uniref:Integrase n=2 Tax=Geofilum TaxID=1236988 RepID=A0A0E9LTY9_9BACT|nr:integrase [Geofilum rubicundum JCM 15548]